MSSACSPSKSTAAPAWPSPTIGPCAHFSTQVRTRQLGGWVAVEAQETLDWVLVDWVLVEAPLLRQPPFKPTTHAAPACPLLCRREGAAAGPPLLQVPWGALP